MSFRNYPYPRGFLLDSPIAGTKGQPEAAYDWAPFGATIAGRPAVGLSLFVCMKIKTKFIFISAVLLSLVGSGSVFALTYGVQTKTSHCIANAVLPDPSCTPGAILTTDTKIICVSGYTKTVRNVPLSRKKNVFREYGISYALRSNYEVDHLISLELGGSNDIANLWPEARFIKNGSRVKDAFENHLHKQVCSGLITIQEAQREIATNWLEYAQPAANSQKDTDIPAMTSTAPVQVPTPTPVAPAPAPPPTFYQPTQEIPDNSGVSIPVGATARCVDGTYSFSQTRSGTCSHHGGVMQWLVQ